MLADIVKAIPIGFVMAFLIGPVFFALLETSAIKGFRAALSLDLGVVLADIVFLFIAFFMTSSILKKLENDPGLYVFGGSILAVYGIISYIRSGRSYRREVREEVEEVQKNNYLQLFVKGFLLNFINIGVLGFWLGLILVVSPQLDNDSSRVFVFFSSVLVTYLAVDLVKIILAKSLNKYLTPLRIFYLKRFIAIIMGICGAVLISKGLFPDMTEQLEEQFIHQPESEDDHLDQLSEPVPYPEDKPDLDK